VLRTDPRVVVLFDLTLTPFDVIRVRSRDADDYGSVRLLKAFSYMRRPAICWWRLHARLRLTVLARPGKGRRPESINEYLQRVRLGQTEKSSFSLTVLSPYAFEATSQTQVSFFAKDAFGRRVTHMFAPLFWVSSRHWLRQFPIRFLHSSAR